MTITSVDLCHLADTITQHIIGQTAWHQDVSTENLTRARVDGNIESYKLATVVGQGYDVEQWIGSTKGRVLWKRHQLDGTSKPSLTESIIPSLSSAADGCLPRGGEQTIYIIGNRIARMPVATGGIITRLGVFEIAKVFVLDVTSTYMRIGLTGLHTLTCIGEKCYLSLQRGLKRRLLSQFADERTTQ